MKRPKDFQEEENVMGTLVELTSAFEGIASSRLATIKSEVLKASDFFDELWAMYSQLRVDNFFHFGRGDGKDKNYIDKDLYILITAGGGFSGDIDQKLINLMVESYSEEKQDIVVIGRHGMNQLSQLGIKYAKYYKLPSRDQNINVTPLVKDVQRYRTTTIFYQRYVSLTIQKAESIKLSTYVQDQGKNADSSPDETITEINYIFEPSVFAVVSHLERSMLVITLSQLILDSKLAQYASRFRAMSAAHHNADDSKKDLHTKFRKASRMLKDERLKETTNSLRMIRLMQ